jgi:hypothetical protein
VASIQKIAYIHYVDGNGRRVPKGTDGARRVQTQSRKYYACWREGKRQVRVPLATDYQASQVLMAELIRRRERGEAGLINPFKEHLDRALSEHVQDYVDFVRSTTRCEHHHKEVARILSLFMKESRSSTLRDVTPDRVSTYLSRLTSGPTTRNLHRRYIVMFMNHMEDRQRIERNPITRKSVKPAKKGKRRLRRALTADEIMRLLDAVREYPLRTGSINRGGRYAKIKPAERPANLKPATVAKLTQRGQERCLMYRLAVLSARLA